MLKRTIRKLNTVISQVEEIVNVSKETFKETQTGWISLSLPVFPKKSDGQTYYVSNAALLKVMKISSNTPAIMAANNGIGETLVLCNEAFEKQIPAHIKAAFIAHEYGHIANGDLDIKIKRPKLHMQLYMIKRLFGNKVIAKQEFAADLHAQQQGYDMIGALAYMKRYPTLNHKEFDRRIKNLTMLPA